MIFLFYYHSCLPESWLHIWLKHRLQLRAAASATSIEEKEEAAIFLPVVGFLQDSHWNLVSLALCIRQLCDFVLRLTAFLEVSGLFLKYRILSAQLFFLFPSWVSWMDECKRPWTWPPRARLRFGSSSHQFWPYVRQRSENKEIGCTVIFAQVSMDNSTSCCRRWIIYFRPYRKISWDILQRRIITKPKTEDKKFFNVDW